MASLCKVVNQYVSWLFWRDDIVIELPVYHTSGTVHFACTHGKGKRIPRTSPETAATRTQATMRGQDTCTLTLPLPWQSSCPTWSTGGPEPGTAAPPVSGQEKLSCHTPAAKSETFATYWGKPGGAEQERTVIGAMACGIASKVAARRIKNTIVRKRFRTSQLVVCARVLKKGKGGNVVKKGTFQPAQSCQIHPQVYSNDTKDTITKEMGSIGGMTGLVRARPSGELDGP
eukprot:1157031-Pelagomonas_calceolata.AAC.8